MLTHREYQMLEWISHSASLTYALPLAWNDDLRYQKFNSRRSRWRRIGDTLSLCQTGTKLAFMIIRLVPGYGYSKEELHHIPWNFIIHVLTIIPYVLVLVAQIAGAFCGQELATLVNQLFHFNRATGVKILNREYAQPNMRSRIICMFAGYFMFMVSVSILLCALFPRHVHNLFSLIPEDCSASVSVSTSVVVFILIFLLEAYGWIKIFIVNWFIFCTGYVYIVTTKFWLKNACLNWITSSEINLRLAALQMYRSLTILNTFYNNGFASALFPILKSTLEAGAMFCLVGTWRLYHFTELWIYLLFPLAAPFCILQLVTTISFMASISELSSELGSQFKKLGENVVSDYDEVKRGVKSCRPIFCRIGIIFFVEKSTKLVYMSFLLNTFISLLLTV